MLEALIASNQQRSVEGERSTICEFDSRICTEFTRGARDGKENFLDRHTQAGMLAWAILNDLENK
jgi:hypothetical protein